MTPVWATLSESVENVSCSVVSDSSRPHGILQAWILGCHSLLQGIFPTRAWTRVSCIAGRFFPIWATRFENHAWEALGRFQIPMSKQKSLHSTMGDAVPDATRTSRLLQETSDILKLSRPINISLIESFPLKKTDGPKCTESWQLLPRRTSTF